MSKTEKLYHLHTILSQRRTPANRQYLAEELQCSQATLYRLIGDLRAHGAPIENDTDQGGFYYQNQPGIKPFELPGIWLSSDELHALIGARELLSRVQSGLMQQELSGLEQKITNLLNEKGLDSQTTSNRIRIINQASRRVPGDIFNAIMSSLTHQYQLHIKYHGRGSDSVTERTVSAQRVTSYRNNWYLDAWCHLREDLRSFALERIEVLEQLDDQAILLNGDELNNHYAQSYGIFSGPAAHIAKLRFNSFVSNWVKDEIWHSKQHIETLDDDAVIMSIPFGRSEELIMDIMRYGSDVEVLEPEFLRQAVIEKHQAVLGLYSLDNQ